MIYEGRKEDRKVEKKQISELREEEAIKRRKTEKAGEKKMMYMEMDVESREKQMKKGRTK